MDFKKDIEPTDYSIGVIIARFQVHELHEGHINLIDKVFSHHKKVIIFLGIPVIGNSKSNPLDYASREAMIKGTYPNAIVLPLRDQRSNARWSQELDSQIKVPFGELSALLYGSRDSFIPYYEGKYQVRELSTDVLYSGTEVRNRVSKEILASSDFRAGVIHATYAARPVTYPTVDIVVYNNKGQILMAKKPNENNYRFIGGFVDRDDANWETAAKREFAEETGGNAVISDVKYVASGAIKDWRYSKSESGIMTTLFCAKYLWGAIQPSDDIFSLHWLLPSDINIDTDIMEEHQDLYGSLLGYLTTNNTLEEAKHEVEHAIEDAQKKYVGGV